jgi:exodeoxyribonuclease V gamma subunit
VLVDLFDRGMRAPAPLYGATSAAYAQAKRAGGDAIRAARDEWESGFKFPREDAEPEHVLVLGGVRELEHLLEPPARADEFWELTEPRRFGRWAQRLWVPLLQHEEIQQR